MRLPSGNIWRIFSYAIAAGLALGLLCYGVVHFVDRTLAPRPELAALVALGIGLVLGLCLFIAGKLALRLAVYDLRHTAAEITGQPVEYFAPAAQSDELDVLRATLTNALAMLPDSQLHGASAQTLTAAHDLSQRFGDAMLQLAQDWPLRGAALLLYDGERAGFVPTLTWNLRMLDEQAVLPTNEGAARRVLHERQEAQLSGAEARQVLPLLGIELPDDQDDTPSLLCLALLFNDAPVGILFLIGTDNNTNWSTLWREQARRIADQFTLAVQEARLARDLALEQKRFDTLKELATTLPRAPQLEAALERTLRAVAEATESEHGTLLLLDKNEEIEYRIALTQGTFVPLQVVARSVLRNGLAGWALRERSATLIDDTQRDTRWLPIPGLGEMRSALAVPLIYDQQALGVLTLAHPLPGRYSAGSLALASALTAQVTHILAYDRLAKDSASEQLPETSEQMVANDTLARHLTPSMYHQLRSSDAHKDLEAPHSAEAVVLALSIRNFATASEQLAPEVLIEQVLAPYISSFSAAVQAQQGYLDRCDGAGALAAFGYPQPLPDAAARALRAAQQLQHALRPLRVRWRSQLRCDLSVGIGIALGTVTGGLVVGGSQRNFVLVGAAVNQAQHLQELARAGEVLCSAAVAAALRAGVGDEAALPALELLQPLRTRTGDEQPYRLLTQ